MSTVETSPYLWSHGSWIRLEPIGTPHQYSPSELFIHLTFPDWMLQGACLESELDFMYVSGQNYQSRINVCLNCQVREECLEYALTNRMEDGVWGATTPKQRRVILKMRKKVHSCDNG